MENKCVFLYPDVGAEAKWDALARGIFNNYEIVDLPGMKEGSDVGDVWMGTVV